MKRVCAIAALAVRNALRSRVVLVLLGLLLVTIIVLPLTIKDDGTLASRVQVLLRYTLGAVNIILSIATLWAGCAAVSTEVQGRQIHLIVTKPVRAIELWLGKWLGLMILNAVLLGIAGGATYWLLWWNLRTERDNPHLLEEILVARRVILPEPIPSYSVPPGSALRLTFRLPTLPAAERPFILRYKFASSLPDKDPVACAFLAGAVERPDRFSHEEWSAPGGLHSIAIPRSLLAEDRTLTLDIVNIHPVAQTMVFDPRDGLELLTYEGTFTGNFFRALAVVWGGLGFLAALAVTLGSVFSLPVAALGAGYGVLLTNLGSYLQYLTGEESRLHGIYVALYWVTKPFQLPDPLEKLATGELVSWWWLGFVLLWQVLVCGGILAAVGTWLFNRRELGAAT
jgi:hypothetical protein